MPKAISASHIPSPPKKGTYIDGSKYPKYADAPGDGDDNPGVSALLQLTIQPTNVSFSGLNIIEKDKGTLNSNNSLATDHNADSIWQITQNHDFYEPDAIGRWISLKNMEKTDSENGEPVHRLPQSWTWNCHFCLYYKENENQGELIQNVHQKFQVNGEVDNKQKKRYRFSVSKFNCSVARLNGGEHEFHEDKN